MLLLRTSLLIALSCQGVHQGDPLGSVLFAIGLHDMVCNIKSSIPLKWMSFYLDDLVGDMDSLEKVLQHISIEGPKRGLCLNLSKCSLFCGASRVFEPAQLLSRVTIAQPRETTIPSRLVSK